MTRTACPHRSANTMVRCALAAAVTFGTRALAILPRCGDPEPGTLH